MTDERMSKRWASLAASVALLLAAAAPVTAADERAVFIRDAEIEATIRAYATPLFQAAGLEPDNIRVLLVQKDQINAFVAGGLNLVLYTGLLIRSESASQVIGVIAHETGHIAGGHLARLQQELETIQLEALAAVVAGIGAAVASGQPGAASVIMGAGVGMAQRDLLHYSRTQESSADHAGVGLLDATGQSSRGLLSFLEILQTQELMLSEHQDPYLLSHPLTTERINFLRQHVLESPYSNVPDTPENAEAHRRMKAKLIGFLQPLGSVLRQYPASDDSLAARYARAVAYYRVPDLAKAIPLIDGLIKDRPDDAYFEELKGQMLFENGRLAEALPHYRRAVELQPKAALLRLELAQVEIELDDKTLEHDILAQLKEVTRVETRNADAWRLLSIAYGREGQMAESALALAEAASARGEKKEARLQADRAQQKFPYGSPGYQRAQDILSANKSTD
jgi:predicted Zn-dependent protease